MEYVRVTSIEDPLFAKMHTLMQQVFPPEEVLEFNLWEEPLKDSGIHVYVAVHDGNVVGATEYRFYENLHVAMTDFTIIGKAGLGIGRFLMKKREENLLALAEKSGQPYMGMFAEIYDPYRVEDHSFGGIKPMDPYVRREVLSHIGYKRLELSYVHPSWKNTGEAVTELDLCFLPADDKLHQLPATLVHTFLSQYYAILPNKPVEWQEMMQELKQMQQINLLPL